MLSVATTGSAQAAQEEARHLVSRSEANLRSAVSGLRDEVEIVIERHGEGDSIKEVRTVDRLVVLPNLLVTAEVESGEKPTVVFEMLVRDGQSFNAASSDEADNIDNLSYSKNPEMVALVRDTALYNAQNGGFLHGGIWAGELNENMSVFDLVRQGSSLTVRGDESIAGVKCRHLIAETSVGRLELWIAPELDALLMKYRLTQLKPGEVMEKFAVQMEATDFESGDGRSYVTEARYKESADWVNPDWKPIEGDMVARRNDVEFEAFTAGSDDRLVLTHLKDGAPALTTDRDVDYTIPMAWKDGEIVVADSTEALDYSEDAVNARLAARAGATTDGGWTTPVLISLAVGCAAVAGFIFYRRSTAA